MHSLWKGVLLSTIPLLLILLWLGIPWYSGSKNLISETENSLPYFFILSIISLPIILYGGIMGFLTTKIQERRFFLLSISAIVLYIVGAIWIAGVIVFMDEPSNRNVLQRISDSVKLGLTGSVLFSIFFLPVIIGITYILERWTRSRG